MSNYSEEKWERIKIFAARLQALNSILEIFSQKIDNQPFAREFKPVEEQLRADFNKTLTELLELIDDDATNL